MLGQIEIVHALAHLPSQQAAPYVKAVGNMAVGDV